MSDTQTYEINQILQEMRSDYWRNLEVTTEEATSSSEEYTTVRCAGHRYGLPAALCREVLKLPRLVRVPRLPEHLRGIFNLRGEIVAVTDICPLLGQELQELDHSCRLVVVEKGAMKTALLVSSVEGLGTIEDDTVEPLTEGAGQGARDLIRGKVVQAGDVLVLIDLDGLLERPELIVNQKAQADA
jgi:purine-binding chemotaxis protein CheW